MKVKIGDNIYDGHDQPVMVILTDRDKLNIQHMNPSAKKYCVFPDTMNDDEIKKFMEVPDDCKTFTKGLLDGSLT